MTENSSFRKQSGFSLKLLIIILLVGLLAGAIGAVLGASLFAKQGPAGVQGEKGDSGSQGLQGVQGVPGINGTDSILQIVQNRNSTTFATDSYNLTQWSNASVDDSSLKTSIIVQAGSKLFVQFSASHKLEPPMSIWIRIVVDDLYNSSKYECSTGPPASGTYQFPGHIEFLTDALNAGSHTITVQFYLEDGSPPILERTLTIIEMRQ